MLTNRVIKYNGFFYCWFGSDCSRYRSKGACVTAVSNKENITYGEASSIVNQLLSNEECITIKERVSNLEGSKLDIEIMKNSYESILKTSEANKDKRKIVSKLKSIRKKAEVVLSNNRTHIFKFNVTSYKNGDAIVHNPVSKLFPSLKISDTYTIETYMDLLKEIHGLIERQTPETKDNVIQKLRKRKKEYSYYIKHSDLFINQLVSMFV